MSTTTDEQLVAGLSGFSNQYIDVNGTTLHVVEGGQGEPLLLLPGWPQTWWAYHKIMPALVAHFKVIAVDVRGMGSSAKPDGGYDKKNMALDIYELVKHFGFTQVSIAGHDISATVVHSFAAQFPEIVSKVVFIDTPPVDPNIHSLPMLPPPGYPGHVYPWWLGFNQVANLPEQLLEGRSHILLNYIYDNLLADKSSLSAHDREVYTSHYDRRENIRSGNKWYQAFPQDVIDSQTYGKLTMPVLGVIGEGGAMLKQALPVIADNFTVGTIAGCGHFIAEEKPDETIKLLKEFLL
jgi:pimeloyl-ACP methyl ester carboxylesterase